MAASIAVRSMASVLSLILLLGPRIMASAQSVTPSNGTLPPDMRSSETVLSLTGVPVIPGVQMYNIAPLTSAVGKGESSTTVASIHIQGTFRAVDASSTAGIGAGEIAFISCDPNGSNIDPSTIVGNVGNQTPKAIVLYSLTAEQCMLNGSYQFTSMYTMISSRDSTLLMSTVNQFPTQTNLLMADIAANTTNTSTNTPNSPQSSDGNRAPTTAVAMSILYSITGIITLLFLVIIATGAVRAHRHPERYGPRTGFPGRPRQSRAKGLGRAILETLPIVKFGDPEPVKPGQDIEMGGSAITTHTSREVVATPGNTTEEHNKETSTATATTAVESGMGPAQAESVKSKEETAPKEGELGCSICTEDFTTGEDVRVLPCNHKYHPACIDPWLLNVSGTCPLCRHDLRPADAPDAENPESSEGGDLPPPLAGNANDADSDTNSNHRSRTARLLDLRRLRHAPVDERIAGLRRLREEQNNTTSGESLGTNANGDPDADEPGRRARLATRLRDRFRVKTAPSTSTSPPAS